jgi:hypothetical protein
MEVHMMTLRVDSPMLRTPKVYLVCGPTAGCGKAFLIGPEKCPHCGHPACMLPLGGQTLTIENASAPSFFERLFNWEYTS